MEFGSFISEGMAIGIDEDAKQAVKSISDLTSDLEKEAKSDLKLDLLSGIKGFTPELAIGANMAINARGVTTNNAKPSSNTRENSTVINILTEQNRILSQLLRKDQDIYIDGEKVTDIVNANNAIMATISKF